jgi:hypothetical protein
MSIVSNLAPRRAREDLEKHGRWQYVIRRQIGDYLVTWQWIRIKYEDRPDGKNSTYRLTYFDPKNGNHVFHVEEGTHNVGW